MESGEYSMENRIIIEGIYLMLNMNDTSALHRAVQLKPSIKTTFIIRMSIQISLNFHLKNFYKLLRDIQELPHLVSAIASLKLPAVRKEILAMFSIAYNSSTLKVPIDFLQRLLIYDETENLTKDLNDLGICSSSSEEKPAVVKFERKKFDSSKLIVSRKGRERLIDVMAGGMFVNDVKCWRNKKKALTYQRLLRFSILKAF